MAIGVVDFSREGYKNRKDFLGYVDSYEKTFLILYPSLENSTTGIAITYMTHTFLIV